MLVSFPIFPSFLTGRPSDMDISNNPSRQIENTVDAVAETARLGPQGRQALLEWTTWAIYASALDLKEPHLSEQPGWKVVLAAEHNDCRSNLMLFLLRAGEEYSAAQFAKKEFYKHGLIADFQDALRAPQENTRLSENPAITPTDAAWREWVSKLPVKDLPPHAVPFTALPLWARETAVFATNMSHMNCRGMPGLAQLNLRYLHAPCVNLENCDLRGTNFSMAYMPGAIWTNARTDGAILPEESPDTSYFRLGPAYHPS